MSDRDRDRGRLDRMERKLNRIGRFVLLGIALISVLVVVDTEPYYGRFLFGYERSTAAVFIVLVLVFVSWARVPFRD